VVRSTASYRSIPHTNANADAGEGFLSLGDSDNAEGAAEERGPQGERNRGGAVECTATLIDSSSKSSVFYNAGRIRVKKIGRPGANSGVLSTYPAVFLQEGFCT